MGDGWVKGDRVKHVLLQKFINTYTHLCMYADNAEKKPDTACCVTQHLASTATHLIPRLVSECLPPGFQLSSRRTSSSQ